MPNLVVTKELRTAPPLMPGSITEVFANGGGSAAGYHAVSTWLECPEKSRLRSRGVQRKWASVQPGDKLNELDYGTLIHAFRALRIVYGHVAAMECLERLAGLSPVDYMRARLLLDTYELTYPQAHDVLRYMGVEVEVVSDISRLANAPREVLRTVRYDTLAYASGDLFSIEAKTMARSGASSLAPYKPQAAVQVMVWNSNPDLVAKYGPMVGVIFDCYVKTQVPSVERRPPEYISNVQQRMAAQYMASPEFDVMFRAGPDGKYQKNLHACWGRWSPCQYIGACWEESYGEYEVKQPNQLIAGEVVEVEPTMYLGD